MHFDRLKRREFITLLSGAVAGPLAARAQQPTMPVIGFMIDGTQARSQQIAAFYAGLKESGYIQDQNVAVEFRSAEGHLIVLRRLQPICCGTGWRYSLR